MKYVRAFINSGAQSIWATATPLDVSVVEVCPEDVGADVVADAVDRLDGLPQPHLPRLQLQDVLAVAVGDLRGLPDEGGVYEVAAGDFLVEILEAGWQFNRNISASKSLDFRLNEYGGKAVWQRDFA